MFHCSPLLCCLLQCQDWQVPNCTWMVQASLSAACCRTRRCKYTAVRTLSWPMSSPDIMGMAVACGSHQRCQHFLNLIPGRTNCCSTKATGPISYHQLFCTLVRWMLMPSAHGPHSSGLSLPDACLHRRKQHALSIDCVRINRSECSGESAELAGPSPGCSLGSD